MNRLGMHGLMAATIALLLLGGGCSSTGLGRDRVLVAPYSTHAHASAMKLQQVEAPPRGRGSRWLYDPPCTDYRWGDFSSYHGR